MTSGCSPFACFIFIEESWGRMSKLLSRWRSTKRGWRRRLGKQSVALTDPGLCSRGSKRTVGRSILITDVDSPNASQWGRPAADHSYFQFCGSRKSKASRAMSGLACLSRSAASDNTDFHERGGRTDWFILVSFNFPENQRLLSRPATVSNRDRNRSWGCAWDRSKV